MGFLEKKYRSLLLLILLTACNLFLKDNLSAETAVASLYNYEGKVSVVRNRRTLLADLDMPCREGDLLRTEPGSFVDVIVGKQSGVRLLETGECRLVSASPIRTRFNLLMGNLLVNLRPLPTGNEFEIETPTAIATVTGTQFLVKVFQREDKMLVTHFLVKSGSITVEVKNSSAEIVVLETHMLEVAMDSFIPQSRSVTESEERESYRASSVYIPD